MDVRRDLVISMGVMIALPLLLASNSVLLSTRMGPAIDRVISDNAESMRAAAEVVEVVAEAQAGPLTDDSKQRLNEAFERLEANITEEEEHARIAAMKAAHIGALQGNPAAVRDEVKGALALIDINIEAMHRHNEEAQRLGSANAWAAVFAGLVAFIISRFIAARLRRRIVEPVSDLWSVLRQNRSGEGFARCRQFETSVEVRDVLKSVNELLDQRACSASTPGYVETERIALLALLESNASPTGLVSKAGEILAGNKLFMEHLASEKGAIVRMLLRHPGQWEQSVHIAHEQELVGADGHLVTLV